MNPDPHQQARSWVQQKLDGQLDGVNASLLQDHLRICAVCRAYAARLEHLDSSLQLAYQERLIAGQTVLSRLLSDDSTFHRQMSAKMKRMQVTKFAASLLYIAFAAVAILSFTWLVSTRGRMVLPGVRPTPTSTARPVPPTSTPPSWTKDHPLTSADEIASLLDDLANRNVKWLRQPGWFHVVRMDRSRPGMIRSYYSEGWYRYPQDGQLCMDSMSWIKEKPESTNLVQLLVGTSDGAFGDLIQLRYGTGQVSHSEPGYYSCSLNPEFTAAGELAARLQEEQNLTSGGVVDAKAWYSTTDGEPALFVSVPLPLSAKTNSTGITQMTRSFDLETGAALEEGTRMVNPNGSLFGESLQGVETTFIAELPEDVSAKFEQYANELHTYAAGTSATNVPDNSPVPVVEDQQFIPESAPLDNGPTIVRILQGLKQRQIERLSAPGWYVYGPDVPDSNDWMSNYYLLTHTIDSTGACDFTSYYIRDGQILPQQLVLFDGRWGTLDVTNGGPIHPGTTAEVQWNDGSISTACHLPETNTVSYVQTQIDRLQSLVNGDKPGTFIAWTQGIGRGRYFVVYTDEPADAAATVIDPETHKLEPLARTQSWSYFNLYWGTLIPEASPMVFHLQNGKTIGSPPAPDHTVNVGYHYYTELPPDLKEAFEKTVADLDAQVPK